MLYKREMGRQALAFAPLILMFGFMLAAGCAGTKNTTYFKDIPDSLRNKDITIALSDFAAPKIQSNDLLYISIQTLDPKANSITGNTSGASFSTQVSSSISPSTTNAPGYLVDGNGNIELPLVGTVHLLGLTTTEAKEVIRKKAAIYYKDPVVNVRFANFNITVLGEVNRPAQYTIPSERVSILDAIGMAGDLTIYGRRENVLLIREENGVKKPVRFNLNSSDIMSSPYFYLKQNDVIYVEPNKSRVASSDAVRDRNTGYIISIATSLISISIILLTRL